MAKVDVAEIDRDLLAVTWSWSKLVHILGHAGTIHMPSDGMVYGCRPRAFQGGLTGDLAVARGQAVGGLPDRVQPRSRWRCPRHVGSLAKGGTSIARQLALPNLI